MSRQVTVSSLLKHDPFHAQGMCTTEFLSQILCTKIGKAWQGPCVRVDEHAGTPLDSISEHAAVMCADVHNVSICQLCIHKSPCAAATSLQLCTVQYASTWCNVAVFAQCTTSACSFLKFRYMYASRGLSVLSWECQDYIATLTDSPCLLVLSRKIFCMYRSRFMLSLKPREVPAYNRADFMGCMCLAASSGSLGVRAVATGSQHGE